MYYFDKNDHLNKYLSIAIAFHLAFVFIFFLINLMTNFKPLDLKMSKEAELIQTAVRIDVVGLPRHTLKELEKIDLAAAKQTVKETKSDQNNETSKVEFKKIKKKIDMKSLLAGYSNKKVISKKKRKNIKLKNMNKIILEGNKISQGSSTTGDMIEETQKEYVRYIQSLPDKIRPYWKLPSYLIDKELRCRVRIFLASSGALSKAEIYESSGDEEYDRKALEAVKKAAPFPKPLGSILARIIRGDVILGFPL